MTVFVSTPYEKDSGDFNDLPAHVWPRCAKREEDGSVKELNPIQQKFVDRFAFQCSYCAPGFVNAATVLVEKAQRQPLKKSELESSLLSAIEEHGE